MCIGGWGANALNEIHKAFFNLSTIDVKSLDGEVSLNVLKKNLFIS